MPSRSLSRLISRRSAALTLSVAAAGVAAAALPTAAAASSSQISIIQDPGTTSVTPGQSAATFAEFRALGANSARIFVPWSQIAPAAASSKRPNFNATNPNAYPASGWVPYDTAVRNAARYGLSVDFIVAGGAPQWAEQKAPIKGYNPYFAWKPNYAAFGQFMTALAKRYSGSFAPPGQPHLPRVHFWTIWNEPNFGQNLGPQAIGGSRYSVAPNMYRGLLNAGWKALMSTGHKRDTILVGGYAARGIQGGKYPGDFGQTKPLLFIRTLYCTDRNDHQLRGKTAKAQGCPTNARGSRRFRAQNPALFNASGVAIHPYPNNGSPTTDGRGDPNWATFPHLPAMGRLLDKMTRTYGSGKHFSIYNDEYGYITRPPSNRASGGGFYPSPATAANYINQAEYLSYKDGRIRSYMQYLLKDPPLSVGLLAAFNSGLEFLNGTKKATFFAFNLPVWMPKTSFSRRSKVEVWGDARPANFERNQHVQIQLGSTAGGPFTTLSTVAVKRNGYFDIKMKFPRSGFVRLSFTYNHDPLLPPSVGGSTITSRVFPIKVH